MIIKVIGAVMILLSCGSFGLYIYQGYKKEVSSINELIAILTFMESELKYHQLSIQELCYRIRSCYSGCVAKFMHSLALALDKNDETDISKCVNKILLTNQSVPQRTRALLSDIGKTFGCFDLDGQITQLEYHKAKCIQELEGYIKNKEGYIHSCQTLGLCAGAAVAILLI